MKRLFVIITTYIFIMTPLNLFAANVIDEIIFNNFDSENTHQATLTDTNAGTGALGEGYRRCNSTDAAVSSISFSMSCDPTTVNYLTVKFWGSDVISGRQQLFLYDGNTQIGKYYGGIPESEIMYWDTLPGYQDRFYYSTYIIPSYLTSNKSRLTIKLAGAQMNLYRAYTHLDPFFTPTGEIQGTNPGLGEAFPDYNKNAYNYLLEQAEQALDEMMTWQKWGPEWDAKIAAGEAFSWMTGATTWDGRGGNATMTEQEFKEDLYSRLRSGNCIGMTVPLFYAKAYHAEWSKYYHDPEMINRAVKALDWYCIVQGANGAFDNPWNKSWIGGPDRINGAGCLEGFGVRGPAEAFLLLKNEISEEILNQVIDNDGDQVADVTRGDAWIQLFEWSRDHLMSDRGHATNQDVAQQYAAWQHNEALIVLAPQKGIDRSTMLETMYRATGILPADYYDEVTHWFSNKGIPCEGPGTSAGGYCGSYGVTPLAYTARYCGVMNDLQLDNQFRKMFHGWSNFCYPINDEDGYANLVCQCVINSRPNTHYGKQFPSIGHTAGVAYAALELNEPVAIRAMQLFLQNNRLFDYDYRFTTVNTGPNAHLSSYAEDYVNLVDIWEDLETLEPTDYRFPMEDSQPDFAWADEQAQAVIIKDNDAKLFIALNWRKPTDDRSHDGTSPSNVARIHYMDDKLARVANIPMETPHGLYELYLCNYGKYFIIMNESESMKTYGISIPPGFPDYAIDLISGQNYNLTNGNIIIPPQATIILSKGPAQFCGDIGTEYLDADINNDCSVNIIDFAILASNWYMP